MIVVSLLEHTTAAALSFVCALCRTTAQQYMQHVVSLLRRRLKQT
jgi:hypothetical protein